MRNISVFIFSLMFVCTGNLTAVDQVAPMVMLKLDDLVRNGRDPQGNVSERWQRVTDFLRTEKIKANYGIICQTLDSDCPGYVAWLKDVVSDGNFELWNHGWYGKFPDAEKKGPRIGEFLGASVEEQRNDFARSYDLVAKKVGVTMIAYGPHASPLVGPDAANAYQALAQIPQVKLVYYYKPPEGLATNLIVVPRLMELEKPIFSPNAENVQKSFEAKGKNYPLITLQGHPNQWDEPRFEQFCTAVKYLRAQGCQFVTASEYVAHIAKQ